MATKTAAKAAPKAPSNKPIKEALSKSGLVAHIAGDTGLEAKAVKLVLASLESTIANSISKKGAGLFVMPGLFKATATKIPAKPKRRGINPLTGKEQEFAAKPATIRVKIRPLKKLKDAAL